MIAWRNVEEIKEELAEMLDVYLPDGGYVKFSKFNVPVKGCELKCDWGHDDLVVIFGELDILIKEGAPNILIGLSDAEAAVDIRLCSWRRIDDCDKLYTMEVLY